MSELKEHVDRLFHKYGKADNLEELKAEILSNLEAKQADLIRSGVDEASALRQTRESMTSVEHLIDGNKKIVLHPYRLELLQYAMLYLVAGWVLTVPFTFFRSFLPVNLLLFAAFLLAGIAYLSLRANAGGRGTDRLQDIRLPFLRMLSRTVWGIWAMFIVVSTASVTGLFFGSNIWFGRAIHIDGPYQFAFVAAKYAVPFVTVIIPLLGSKALSLIPKHEAGDSQ